MGRTRGGRRHVLQLNDNKESYLAKYGYSRQEEDEDDDDGSDKEAEEEETIPVDPHKGPPDTPDIDDKVANFLAEIQAIDPEDEEEERPSFKNGGGVSILPPTFSLNANQQQQLSPGRSPEPELPPPKKTVNAYRSMFVKGESEFVRKQEDLNIPNTVTEEVEWPEEPTTVWQQTLDENTQFHYYWNTVTNEVTWEIPPEFTQYLLLYKEYEEKVEKLKKEGKTKPPPKPKEEDRNGAVPVIPGDLEAISSSAKAVCDPPYNGHTSVVPEGSVTSSSEAVTDSNEAPSSILKNKNDSPATVLPDSTNSKSKTPQLVAYHGGSSDESSTDSSEDSENSDNDEKKPAKQSKDQDTDDIDLDDIDKALEMALEKKKTSKEHKSKSKSSESSKSHKDKKSSDKAPKTKSLVDAMREHVQQKQEVEARRKAAIEEMMARELERRVGPPRKRPTPEEPSLHGDWESSKRAKVMEYEHGRRSRRGEEYEHSLSKSSQDRDYDRDSRHKRDDHKKHKKDDRDRKRDDSKKRDEHGKRKHDEKKKDEKKKHKDKDRDREKDDRKKDKKKEKQRDEDKVVQEEKQSEEKRDVKKEQSKVLVKKDEEEAEVPRVKKELHSVPSTEKKKDSYAEYMESNLTAVQLANLKLQASELVELALSKLEFLEVTKKGLSKLQILLVELETRQHDWQNGGLSTEYFLLKLEEANRQLQQYEQSAAPPGWSCHWDRAYRRYFYMNKKSNRTQWDYPDDDEEEDIEENIENSRHSTSSSPSREQSFDDEVSKKSETVLESCDETSKMDASHPETKSNRHSRKHRHDGHEAKDQSETSPKQLDTTRMGDPSNEVESMATEKACSDEDVSMDNEPVSSSTASVLLDTDSVTADTTTSVITAMEEIFQGKSNYNLNKAEPQPPLPSAVPSQSFDFTSTTATVSVLQGQPPPPGTDLDFLLAAPPPPPPPPPEGPSGVTMEMADSYDLNTPVLMDTRVASYPSLDMEPMVHSSDMDSTSVHPSEVVSSDQMYDSEAPGVLPVEQTETAVIARPPQVFSRDSHAVAEPVSSVETSSSEPYLPEAAGPSGDVPSSSGIYSEKKKKKKDKSMSSSGLHLKKKNVSSLVQKWQKVKKEVEIEERHREERDQAIRQKLEEWKQEYNCFLTSTPVYNHHEPHLTLISDGFDQSQPVLINNGFSNHQVQKILPRQLTELQPPTLNQKQVVTESLPPDHTQEGGGPQNPEEVSGHNEHITNVQQDTPVHPHSVKIINQGRYVYTPHPKTGQLLYITSEGASPQFFQSIAPVTQTTAQSHNFVTPKVTNNLTMTLNSSGEEGQDSSSAECLSEELPTSDTTPNSSLEKNNKFFDITLFTPCVGEDGREQHNMKERRRRARIKDACDVLRKLVPGMSDKTDKATVFEFAARYVHFLKGFVGNKHDKDFLLKYSPY